MTPERWKQIEDIFHKVLDLPADTRKDYLNEFCDGDEELRSEVLSLLTSNDETGPVSDNLIQGAAQSLIQTGTSRFIGKRIDAYRITGLIGEGGMAEVYRAVRDDDEYQKQVAIKLIKQSPGASFLVQRFRHERQILASLEHPCIARFLEGGSTEDGLPYLVMEYIDGEPITSFCSRRNLPLSERLQLFRMVCGAVQHAHKNLVIHRDLKPSNILVTPDGVPKLLDFGIAKLLNPELVEEYPTIGHTVTSIRLMTPEYASPEQVRGETVTTATDVYSLGAVLYEILTGIKPHQFKSRAFAEIERVVCDTDPARPSQAVWTQRRLSRELAVELDNIVLMAMQKEPLHRYHSAEQLAEDIDRYLTGQPIVARIPTLSYRAGKFVRRHVYAVAAAAAFVLIAIFFVASIVRERTRAEEARIQAEHEAARANAVNSFLQTTLASANPFGDLGRDVTVVEALNAADLKIEESFRNQPDIEAEVRDTIGFTFLRLGKYDEAEKQLKKALEIRQRLYPGNHEDVAEELDNLGTLYQEKGKLNDAEQLFRQALSMRRAVHGNVHARTAQSLNNLAVLLREKDQIEEAEKLHREALNIRRKVLSPDHDDLATSLNNLASILFSKNDLAGAESMFREVLALDHKRWGKEHPNVAVTMNNLAFVLEREGKLQESENLYKQILDMNQRLLGAEHPLTATAYNNLGSVMLTKGDVKSAEELFRKCLEIRRRILEPRHPHIGIAINNLGLALQKSDRCSEAAGLFREAISIFLDSDFDPLRRAKTKTNLGDCLLILQQFDEAEKWLTEAHSELSALRGPDSKEAKEAQDHLRGIMTSKVK
jgi:serine/threonine-protein kinase